MHLNQKLPSSIVHYSGLITMGGTMSANDCLPWLAQEQALIQAAYRAQIPIAGHCLGSQILSKALGATVRPNKHKEIGWHSLHPLDQTAAEHWFGPLDAAPVVFQWHSDTFDLPPAATPLFSSAACKNQAYVLADRHVAIQFHLEMTPSLIEQTVVANEHVLPTLHSQFPCSVNTAAQLRAGIAKHVPAMHQMLLHMYTQWSKNLNRT